ncbi:nickel pincer cofactor biosynthesis protein LarC [Gloeocapsopsis crepidinum LEGE 06123]|uniref:Putative nickel insertion protein n=1 Tax=Gloeocapsopsis crepidinum LEGE 06123 TaxID=588587 RepID=A0ABR9UP62_9CHRO|nr:nickel pincer cofactor biosynthesis protein LarC [Gloeocapsopsis crepidinum]MBE9190076.1 nickel pincer cofactor biosynthesis protein LarC [Gloeocapsopsis crepidinum LEGE 06123]
MTKLAYLECPTGIAGDMCLGALVDVGVPLEYLIEQLKKLGIAQEYELQAQPVHRNGQLATKVHVKLQHHQNEYTHHHGRHLPEIEQIIIDAKLPLRAQKWSLEVFRQLAVAEGAVHGIAPEKVHFHEVGAVDAIVDIVGTCLGLDWLEIDKLYCSALPTGGGTVKAAHGRLPVPVPAVLKLWQMRGCPVYSNNIERELVTPTGAAIATTLAHGFGAPPAMTIHKIGLGPGSIDLPIPNILRLWLGESRDQGVNISDPSSCVETIAVLETQIDDLSPQAIGYVFEALFEAGAVDVFTQSIGMKKSRLGILLSVICHPEQLKACEAVLFQETTTLGIRHSLQQRTILPREIQKVGTKYGTVRVKVAWMGKKLVNIQPEYEDCAQLAKKHQIAWREIHRQALSSWYAQHE